MPEKLVSDNDLIPEYLDKSLACRYLRTTPKKLALFRKYEMLKYAKLGKEYVYKRSWLDDFMENWAGYDLSNQERVKTAINEKRWRAKQR